MSDKFFMRIFMGIVCFALLVSAAGILIPQEWIKRLKGEKQETKTQIQDLTIFTDGSFKPITEQVITAFESSNATIYASSVYTSEENAIQSFTNGQVGLIGISRELSEAELQAVKEKGLAVDQTKVAFDALVFVVNKNNANDVATVNDITSLLKSDATTWPKALAGSEQAMQLAYCTSDADMIEYVNKNILQGKNITPNAKAVNTSDALLQFVAEHPNALGIISLSELAYDLPALKEIKPVKIAAGNSNDIITPDPVTVAKGAYPFVREWYLISSKGADSPEARFATFLTSSSGQSTIQKGGMIPMIPVPQEVTLRSNE